MQSRRSRTAGARRVRSSDWLGGMAQNVASGFRLTRFWRARSANEFTLKSEQSIEQLPARAGVEGWVEAGNQDGHGELATHLERPKRAVELTTRALTLEQLSFARQSSKRTQLGSTERTSGGFRLRLARAV